jgi:hypothetical protein
VPSFNIRSNAVGYDLIALPINITLSGDNIVIPSPSGIVTITRIFKLALVAVGITSLLFKDTQGNVFWGGAGNALSLLAGGSITLDFDTQPWFTCAPGAGFIINSSAGVNIAGGIYYNQTSTGAP